MNSYRSPAVEVRDADAITSSDFQKLWSHGDPILITGIQRRLQGCWSPEGFIREYGAEKVTRIDFSTDDMQEDETTAAEFFRLLKECASGGRPWKLKVSDLVVFY